MTVARGARLPAAPRRLRGLLGVVTPLFWCFCPGSALDAQDVGRLGRLQAAVDSFATAEGVPAIVVTVVENGRTTSLTHGVSDVRAGMPVTEHTRFAIGSVTKSFTATAIMTLVEEGRLSTADTLGSFFPRLPADYRGITIDQLLRHRSGIRRDIKLGHSLEGPALIDVLADTPLLFSPGEAMAYSNTGFVLLGMIVGRTTGLPLGTFLHRRVFEPLGMDSTVYYEPGAPLPAMATGYEEGLGHLMPVPFLPARHGAGSLLSTAHDLALWARANLRGDLLTHQSRDAMWLMALGPPSGDLTDGLGRPFEIGSGWWRTDDGGRLLVQHGGSLDGFLATVDLYPREGLGIVALMSKEGAPLLSLVERVSTVFARGTDGSERGPLPKFVRVADFDPPADRASTGGVSWVDYDHDGDPDLFVANGYDVSLRDAKPQPNRLYENLGEGRMRRVDDPVLADSGFSSGSAWADLDNDGALDLFVPNQRGQSNFLYRGDGRGGFQRLSSAPTLDKGVSFAGTWADVDGDGLVDLMVTNGGLSGAQPDRLYRNLGEGRFEPVTEGPVVSDTLQTFGPSWVDYDLDGDVDLFVAGRSVRLYRNDGGFRLTPVSAPFVNDGELYRSYAGAWGDYDNDGDFDLHVSSVLGINHLYVNEAGRFRLERSTGSSLGEGSIHTTWADLDNSGYLDLIVASWGSPAAVYLDVAIHGFERVALGDLGREVNYSASMALADYDGDGDLDVLVAHWPNAPGPEEENHLYRNDGPTGAWLRVDLVGSASNRAAIGARIVATVHLDGRLQRLTREIRGSDGWRSQNEATAHFGLGEADQVESLEIHWPSGLVQRLGPVAAGRRIEVTEGERPG